MTIKDYMRKVESAKMTPKDSAGASFTDAIMENTEIWSNDACVGYFLRAAQIVGLDQADTRKVVEAFNTAFDGTSVGYLLQILSGGKGSVNFTENSSGRV